jgi:CheY-like chemotaxis protein
MEHSNGNTNHGSVHIMVVEDEPFIRMLLADGLRDFGFTVIEAATADEAIAYPEMGTTFDLVLTDIKMPGSMNGLDLARLLRRDNPSFPIIIMSAHLGNQCVDDLGPFLQKPYRLDEAAKLVFGVLGLEWPQAQSRND